MPVPQRQQQRYEVSVSSWQRLDELVHAALEQRLEQEQEAERRRRDKLQRFRYARSFLGPGVLVQVHEMWVRAGSVRHHDGRGGVKRMLAAVCSAR